MQSSKQNLTKKTVDNLIQNNKQKGLQSNNYSEGDNTDLSTHGSIMSRQQQYFDVFPEIPSKIQIRKTNKNNSYYMFQSAGKKKVKNGGRRLSGTGLPIFTETIQEIEQYLSDEEEDDCNKKQPQFKHVELVQDHKEFSDRLQRIFKSQRFINENYNTRIRANSFDKSKLPQVLEVKDDQEDEIAKKHNKQIMINGIDQNEFGNSGGSAKRGSVKINLQNDIIQEEQEQENDKIATKKKSKFEAFSPNFRLKVDELDSYQQKKSEGFGFYDDEVDEDDYEDKNRIEPIQEEEKESMWETESVQKMEQCIEKLHREVSKISQDDEQQSIIEATKNHLKNEESRVQSIQEMDEYEVDEQ